ncbi:aminoacetone oxidase family FAD-binding enzyme [Caulobacter sp. SLTY]|uniref:NAD(P)/FAD-dependent oxidoreductase n=1 Tax=Caulobacter sp. SLTY TaxID=2683262 RepID=UPI00141375B5|nr:NAD(P)/FAD-dependent oxidoreductase [Caulobacter sp. SLTY]NBB16437.1 aminoacetone oxidase family FAD-binding enzyme [Caulobacter sp. SLTY]
MARTAETFDVVIVGAGAAGMMCAIEAGKRGRRVLVLDHAAAPGEKIRISGGGRCNFTNLEGDRPDRYLSANPHFARSALSRYRPRDFIALVEKHGIAWHEKTLGQLFCDGSAKQIVAMLLDEMRENGAILRLNVEIDRIEQTDSGFEIAVGGGRIACESLVAACGGKSIPKMGATGFAYEIARQFEVPVLDTRPALVPLTFAVHVLDQLKPLAGVAVNQAVVGCGKTRFTEDLLFTHRGLSGPAILQISSYWREGDELAADLAPGLDVLNFLKESKRTHPKTAPHTALAWKLPKALAVLIADTHAAPGNLADQPDRALKAMADAVNAWRFKPVGSEGYRTAEVTLGGIDTAALDQKTMAARGVPGLYFIGECVDVTGWLGGYNFQWAWASGWVAGQSA